MSQAESEAGSTVKGFPVWSADKVEEGGGCRGVENGGVFCLQLKYCDLWVRKGLWSLGDSIKAGIAGVAQGAYD